MQLIQVNFVWTYLTNEDYRWNQLKYFHISDVMWCDQFDLHLLQSIFKLSYKSFDWRLTFAFFLQKKDKKCLMCLMWSVTSISSRIPSFSSSTSNGCTVYCDFNRHLECCKYLEMIIECFLSFSSSFGLCTFSFVLHCCGYLLSRQFVIIAQNKQRSVIMKQLT